jgi:prepilin-type processing-associated H-X9-DG protein
MHELQRLCQTAAGRNKTAPSRHLILHGHLYYQHINSPNTPPGAWDSGGFHGIASKPPSSRHNGGVSILLVDGSVRFVSDTIDELTWRELGSRNSDDDFDHF